MWNSSSSCPMLSSGLSRHLLLHAHTYTQIHNVNMQKVNLKEKANDVHWLEWLGIRTSLQVQNYLSEMARLWGLHAGLGKSLSPRRSAWLLSSTPADEPLQVLYIVLLAPALTRSGACMVSMATTPESKSCNSGYQA